MTFEQKLSMLYQSEHSQYLCPRKDIPTQREQRGTEGTNNWGKRLVIFNQEHKLRALAHICIKSLWLPQDTPPESSSGNVQPRRARGLDFQRGIDLVGM